MSMEANPQRLLSACVKGADTSEGTSWPLSDRASVQGRAHGWTDITLSCMPSVQ